MRHYLFDILGSFACTFLETPVEKDLCNFSLGVSEPISQRFTGRVWAGELHILIDPALQSEMETIIETPRLTLRHFVESDLEVVAALMADPDFMKFSTGIFSREQSTSFLFDRLIAPARQGLPSQFAVVFRAEGRLIGYCGFFRQDVDGVEETEIGYRLHPAYWNRGLATEGARAVRDYAFEILHLKRVISLIHPENHASRRVAENNHMVREKETTFRGFPVVVFACERDQTFSDAS